MKRREMKFIFRVNYFFASRKYQEEFQRSQKKFGREEIENCVFENWC